MLINLTNHPSTKWSETQTEAAKRFGEIVDLSFPQVDPKGDETYIANLAEEYCQKVLELADGTPIAVHVMGEMTLTFAIVKKLQAANVVCMASTTERIVHVTLEGNKESLFQFVGFRNYL